MDPVNILPSLKFVALPNPEIIGGTQKIGHSLDTPTLPFLFFLFGREVILDEFQPMSSRYLIVTDRRTDGQTKAISIPRYAVVHRAVKSWFVERRGVSVKTRCRKHNKQKSLNIGNKKLSYRRETARELRMSNV